MHYFMDREGNSRFFKNLITLVIPIAIQNFITSAVNSADVLMLGAVGQRELSAVSLANQFQFVLNGVYFGIASGITILASQYWGKKNTDAIQVIMGIALKLSLAVSALIMVGAVFLPDRLMGLYTGDAELIAIGSKYLRIIGVSYLLTGISQVYMCTQRSVERAMYSTVVSSTALLINVTLNAVFIFGFLGIPKMGVLGVAVATVIARTVECTLCIIDAIKGPVFKLKPSLIIKGSKVLFRDFIKYATPALLNDVAWFSAYSVYTGIMGHINSDMVAANSVASTVRDLTSVLCFAIASGAAVFLGIEIGQGKLKDAEKDAGRSFAVTLGAAVITGIIIILTRPLIFMMFELSPEASEYLNVMLFINSYYIIGMAINTLFISGVFRAGGDSKFGLKVDLIVMWCISLPLGFISAFVLKLPPMIVYFILCLDEFWKLPAVFRKYKSKTWLKDITRENAVD